MREETSIEQRFEEIIERIRIVYDHDAITGISSYLIVAEYGWAETIVATCAYKQHAELIAESLAQTHECDWGYR